MAKKPVPDWLNSSLWSSPPDPSGTDRYRRYSSSSPTAADAARDSTVHLPAPQPPVPPPLPAVDRPEPPKLKSQPPKSDSRDDDANGTSTSDAVSADDISRQAQILVELSKKVVDMREIRRLASMGIPDSAGLRATVWKLLLGYLPSDRSAWPSELSKKRSQYKRFKEELMMNPELESGLRLVVKCSLKEYCTIAFPLIVHFPEFVSGSSFLIVSVTGQSEIARRLEKFGSLENEILKTDSRGPLSRADVTHDDHPLSLGQSSVWNQFFQDTEIIEQIDRDVKRTHPDMQFFCDESSFARSNQEALRSILIVFAKLNPGIRYVQGMNEILAPLYYIFRNDPDEENAACAEEDAFFCFVELLSGFRDNFCQQLDNSVVGIRSTITRLSELLKEHDEELWRHLEVTCKVNPQFYAFRWITLLLTQEFNFPDSLQIWDTLLSDSEGPQETLLRICCSMLIIIRRRLLAGDFTSNLKLLQSYPSTNISHLLYVANKLRVRPAS